MWTRWVGTVNATRWGLDTWLLELVVGGLLGQGIHKRLALSSTFAKASPSRLECIVCSPGCAGRAAWIDLVLRCIKLWPRPCQQYQATYSVKLRRGPGVPGPKPKGPAAPEPKGPQTRAPWPQSPQESPRVPDARHQGPSAQAHRRSSTMDPISATRGPQDVKPRVPGAGAPLARATASDQGQNLEAENVFLCFFSFGFTA